MLLSSLLETTVVTATVENAEDIPLVLERAVERVRVSASGNISRGILVTRHSPGQFSIRLSEDVPFGLTRECYAY